MQNSYPLLKGTGWKLEGMRIRNGGMEPFLFGRWVRFAISIGQVLFRHTPTLLLLSNEKENVFWCFRGRVLECDVQLYCSDLLYSLDKSFHFSVSQFPSLQWDWEHEALVRCRPCLRDSLCGRSSAARASVLRESWCYKNWVPYQGPWLL